MSIYIIEGPIGAGKTTLLKYLYEYFTKLGYKTAICLEPVDLWEKIGILGKFYQNPERYSYIFQSFVYITRIDKIKEMFKTCPNYDIYLIERSPLSDKLFMAIQHNDLMELEMYKNWCNTFDQLLPFDLSNVKLIYLKPDIEICQQRIAKRNRSSESNIKHEYQEKLIIAHNYYFENIPIPDDFKNDINIDLLNKCPILQQNVITIDHNIINNDYTIDAYYEKLLLDKINVIAKN